MGLPPENSLTYDLDEIERNRAATDFGKSNGIQHLTAKALSNL